FVGVKRNDESFSGNGLHECAEEAFVDAAVFEGGAADDDLRGAEFYEFAGAFCGANAAADADFHSVLAFGAATEFGDERVVFSFAHRRVEIDDVKPFVVAKAVEEAEDIGDGEFATAAVDELDGLAALQIDAGNQHERRTSILCVAR